MAELLPLSDDAERLLQSDSCRWSSKEMGDISRSPAGLRFLGSCHSDRKMSVLTSAWIGGLVAGTSGQDHRITQSYGDSIRMVAFMYGTIVPLSENCGFDTEQHRAARQYQKVRHVGIHARYVAPLFCQGMRDKKDKQGENQKCSRAGGDNVHLKRRFEKTEYEYTEHCRGDESIHDRQQVDRNGFESFFHEISSQNGLPLGWRFRTWLSGMTERSRSALGQVPAVLADRRMVDFCWNHPPRFERDMAISQKNDFVLRQ